MRPLLLFAFLAACGGSTTPATDAGGCPYTLDDPCIDEAALAQCQAKAAECGSEMVVMESCPLQFGCPGG